LAVVKPLSSVLTATQTDLPADRPVAVFDDVVLQFSGVRALDDVSFAVGQRELFAVIGPNGAGKTSMFNCLSGVYRPRGHVEVLGHDVATMTPNQIAALGVARTFQNIELFENLTLLDNVMLGRHQHIGYGTVAGMAWTRAARAAEARNREVVEHIIDFLQLAVHRRSLVGMLPYGVQKRVELGRALAMEPKLLLLDEPVAGMNLEETEDMARFILDIREELDIAMILVEHDMGLVMDLADRVLVLDFGQVIAVGAPEEVQRDPAVIQAYLGEEAPDQHEVSGPDPSSRKGTTP
jgi:branched-chain amino acid transport system ATP-binding protein